MNIQYFLCLAFASAFAFAVNIFVMNIFHCSKSYYARMLSADNLRLRLQIIDIAIMNQKYYHNFK